MPTARAFLFASLLLAACGPDLPAGWEGAREVDDLVQTECSQSPFEDYTVELSAVRASEAVEVAYSKAHFRCAQDVTAFWRDAASGVDVLVQPRDMHPSMVAGCDCLYDLTMNVPTPRQSGTVAVFRRWDALNEPNDPVPVGETTF